MPQKVLNNILYYHELTGHRNYHILTDKIKTDGFYWNSLTQDCKEYIKKWVPCTSKNKINILLPPSNQILCSKPKELYLIDITYIPLKFLPDNKDKLYILSILDHFSKFGVNYIINNKEKTAFLSKIKELIFTYGYPEKILTDNGWEFTNKKFIKF